MIRTQTWHAGWKIFSCIYKVKVSLIPLSMLNMNKIKLDKAYYSNNGLINSKMNRQWVECTTSKIDLDF